MSRWVALVMVTSSYLRGWGIDLGDRAQDHYYDSPQQVRFPKYPKWGPSISRQPSSFSAGGDEGHGCRHDGAGAGIVRLNLKIGNSGSDTYVAGVDVVVGAPRPAYLAKSPMDKDL